MNRLGRTLLSLLLLAPGTLPAQGADRSHPPEPGPVRPFHLPPVRRFTLENGLPVLLVEKHEVPVASVLLVVKGGAVSDPAGKPGLAAMTAEMLEEGAGGKDALALDDAISFLGADLKASASWDASSLHLHVPVARLAPALALMADVALRPDFPEKEWVRLRKQKLTEMLEARSEPDLVAARAAARAIFGAGHRYGTPQDGSPASVSAFTTADFRAFHAQRWRPSEAALVVAGDLTAETARPLLQAAFGTWKAAPAPVAAVPAPPQVKGRTIWLVDKPGAAQSAVRIARVGPGRKTPDYVTMQVANTLLGGSFTSRLNDNLREKHGWSYGAGSRFDARVTAGSFGAGSDIQTPNTADGLREMLKELAGMTAPATAAEIGRARSFLALRYAEQFETTEQLTRKLAETFVYGLPESVFDDFVPAAMATTPAQVAEVSRRLLDSKAVAIVVVGDRKVVEKPLRALNAGEVRIVTLDEVMGPAPKIE